MKTIKITSVSYLNTIPFVYGIENSGMLDNYELSLDLPSICAEKLMNNKTDLALVPVAAIINKPEFRIYTDFCIGCDGDVKTVLLLSQVPLQEIKKIHLDSHSVTSVNLVKVLAKKLWNIYPEWISLTDKTETHLSDAESIVAIGDKTFRLSESYRYSYDLGAEWKKMTGLPFVFACWSGKENIPDIFIKNLNNALRWGIQHQRDAVNKLNQDTLISKFEAEKYLFENISFILDEPKRKALKLFYQYLNESC